MESVIAVVMLALVIYIIFAAKVGLARTRYGVVAPATSGHPAFERLFRVQQNTQEQLVVFLPAIFSFAWVGERQGWLGHEIAAALGLVWCAGRILYAVSYTRNPASRGAGFVITLMPTVMLILGTLAGVVL